MKSDFLKKLILTFKLESKDRIQKISDILLKLESDKDSQNLAKHLEIVFREVHSLKSSARAVNFKHIESICQKLEDVLSYWKQNLICPTSKELDIIHKTNDKIAKLVDDNSLESSTSNIDQDMESIITELQSLSSKFADTASKKNEQSAPTPATHLSISQENTEKPDALSTIRIQTNKLDKLFIQAEEMLSVKLNLIQHIHALSELNNSLNSAKKNMRSPDIKSFNHKKTSSSTEKYVNHQEFEYLEKNQQLLENVSNELNTLSRTFEQQLHLFSAQLENLLYETKQILMLPFTALLETFPKIVRDLSRTLEKQVNFCLKGGEIEIDKRILEEMKDVLLHLIRNAVDHGIETPETRKQHDKPETGNLALTIEQTSGNEILLTLSDDGSGINLDAVKKSAIKQNIISEQQASSMTEKDLQALIYVSGVSASPILTDLSGRGLGMAIIREKIEKISGSISIHSIPEQGTKIQIRLPLMIATFKGTLVKVADEIFIIPTVNLERSLRVSPENIKTIENKETLIYEQRTISIVKLQDLLSLPQKNHPPQNFLSIVVVSAQGKKIGFVVDEVLHEQEIIVKNFHKPIKKIRHIAAASILDTGKPVLILNVSDLFTSLQAEDYQTNIQVQTEETEALKHILLVEDSITTRMMLKNIFELSGFQVTTCSDGLEAWRTIKTQPFSAIVSDVDMPNMNGFELTEKVRNDSTLSQLPIILVTARESNQDKIKGIDAGANAYITKSDFEGDNLIQMVQRLIM